MLPEHSTAALTTAPAARAAGWSLRGSPLIQAATVAAAATAAALAVLAAGRCGASPASTASVVATRARTTG